MKEKFEKILTVILLHIVGFILISIGSLVAHENLFKALRKRRRKK